MNIEQAFKEVTGLSIEEGIQKAVEVGWKYDCNPKPHQFSKTGDGTDCVYYGANKEWSVWKRKDNGSSICVVHAETMLDPLFWQALGKSLGWRLKTKRITGFWEAHTDSMEITGTGIEGHTLQCLAPFKSKKHKGKILNSGPKCGKSFCQYEYEAHDIQWLYHWHRLIDLLATQREVS